MKTFDFHGWPVKYVHAGGGEPMILLHNGGTSHAIWNEVMPRLSRHYELFALDLPGFGASARPGPGFTLDHYVAMIGEFVDRHRLAPVMLTGNCMGSAMSLAFAIRRPRDVRALVLVNPLTAATISAGELGPVIQFRRRAPALAGPAYGMLGRLRLTEWIGGQVLRFQTGPEGRARNVEQNAELRQCYAAPGQMQALLAVVDDIESYAALDRFTPDGKFPPLCTIWGLDNRVLSPKAGRTLNQTLRPRREEWLEGCGHLPMLEQPETVAGIIEDFLREHGPSRLRVVSPKTVEAR